LILQLVPVQKNRRCISSFMGGVTSDLGQMIDMDKRATLKAGKGLHWGGLSGWL